MTCEPADAIAVGLSPDVFAWLKDEYGPDAWEWPVCDGYRLAARRGVLYALNNSCHAPMAATITRIGAHPAHSTDDAIAYAAVFATWESIGVDGANHPEIDGNSILFPSGT
mgnify:CR=1 FL=1